MESSKKTPSMWCFIEDIHPTKMKLNKAIKLRLMRIFGYATPANKKEIVSLECLFHDSKGQKISATMPKMFIKKWQSSFKEGLLFGIKNFMVTNNLGRYKITTHSFKLKFTIETDANRMNNDEFPNLMYEFKAFEEIQSLDVIKDGELFDTIGILLNKEESRTITCQSGLQKKLIEFILQDHEGKRICVTLWDEYVDQFIQGLEKNEQPSNIIILRQGQPKLYLGKMIMQSTYNVSKIMVNAEIQEVEDFRKRIVIASDLSTTVIGSQGTNSCITNDVSDNNCELITIDELFFVNENGVYWTAGKVVSVNLEDGWFYISCKICRKKLSKQEQCFYCKKCNRTEKSGDMRLVLDIRDGTSGATVVVWEMECLQLFGKSVAQIVQNEEDIDDLPYQIQDAIMEKTFLFKISKRAQSDYECNSSYSVLQLTGDLIYINKYNRKQSGTQSDTQVTYCNTEVADSVVVLDNIDESATIETPKSMLEVENE